MIHKNFTKKNKFEKRIKQLIKTFNLIEIVSLFKSRLYGRLKNCEFDKNHLILCLNPFRTVSFICLP